MSAPDRPDAVQRLTIPVTGNEYRRLRSLSRSLYDDFVRGEPNRALTTVWVHNCLHLDLRGAEIAVNEAGARIRYWLDPGETFGGPGLTTDPSRSVRSIVTGLPPGEHEVRGRFEGYDPLFSTKAYVEDGVVTIVEAMPAPKAL